ncbi:hypothetical protein LCM17_04245 [Cereibacter sphaeroides]|nr:hypothetical protein [Cereibacter sphaeroides]
MSDRIRDPQADKARDLKRQRKIASNSSDKAARKNAPRIKAMGHRQVRRLDKEALARAPEEAADRPEALKTRYQHWGTENAAERRAERDAERAWLDATPVEEVRGRHRAQKRPWRHED